ncbi:MAG: hypothetical protein KatS3mg089_0934 [Patescibacteria group bacterium]|nr:MAG: hypothetical protein KatS3mg089_0934 [Patescibacteria group bacterium]
MYYENKANIELAIKFIGYIIFFIAIYSALVRVDHYLRLKAFDDCGELSRYETTDKNSRFSYPVLDIYNQCLEDKGLK